MKNWRTTYSAAGAAVMSLLAAVAGAPDSISGIEQYLSPEWRARVFISSAIAAFILKVINGRVQADAPKPDTQKTDIN